MEGNSPSVSDIARRLQRVEDKLDERIATTDMLRSTERLFEAKDIAFTAMVQTAENRITRLESSNAALTRLVVGAFLALLIQAIVLIFTWVSKVGGT